MARKRCVLLKLGAVKATYRPKDNNIEKLKLFLKQEQKANV